MNPPHVFGDVLLTIGTILALLPWASLLSSRYQFERWAKVALIILGLAGIGWGVFGFVDRSIGSRDRWHPLASHMHSLCAGVVIGLVLVLGLSGEFQAARRRRKEAI
jgi:hypothetical protein